MTKKERQTIRDQYTAHQERATEYLNRRNEIDQGAPESYPGEREAMNRNHTEYFCAQQAVANVMLALDIRFPTPERS